MDTCKNDFFTEIYSYTYLCLAVYNWSRGLLKAWC